MYFSRPLLDKFDISIIYYFQNHIIIIAVMGEIEIINATLDFLVHQFNANNNMYTSFQLSRAQ